MTSMAEIETRRQAAGITIDALCVAAGVTSRAYLYNLEGRKSARASTIASLDIGLKKLSGCPADLAQPKIRLVFTAWRTVLALVAAREGVDAAMIWTHDPQKRATLDPDWLRAARLRARATYLAHTVLGLKQADLARALGMTPQAICQTCRAVEDERDNARVDQDLDWIGRQLGAEA